MQLDIVGVITHLAEKTRVQQSVAIIGALSDMMRHLRKSIHCSLDDSNLGTEVIQWNQKYRTEVDECLVQLTIKVTKIPTLKMNFLVKHVVLDADLAVSVKLSNVHLWLLAILLCRFQMQVLFSIPWPCC